MKAATILLAVAAIAGGEACSSGENHLLYGQQYVPTGACLEPTQAIDDIAGADPGSCAPTCLVTSSDGGLLVFVTTTCPPYPSYLAPEKPDASASASASCKSALAAYTAGTLCGPDGSSPFDAAAEAATDAVAEGPVDASLDSRPEGGSDATSDGGGG